MSREAHWSDKTVKEGKEVAIIKWDCFFCGDEFFVAVEPQGQACWKNFISWPGW